MGKKGEWILFFSLKSINAYRSNHTFVWLIEACATEHIQPSSRVTVSEYLILLYRNLIF